MHLSTFQVPSEIIEEILIWSDPFALAAFAQTCTTYRSLVYDTADQKVWRELYLSQPLDDPQHCLDTLGRRRSPTTDCVINWRLELQAVTRASTVIRETILWESAELGTILSTLVNLAARLPSSNHGPSHNVNWLRSQLGTGTFIAACARRQLSAIEQTRLSQLRTLVGYVSTDLDKDFRVQSRAKTYDLSHYSELTSWGPFSDPAGLFTDWNALQPIHHLVTLHVMESDDLAHEAPPNLSRLQGPENANAQVEGDWIGITGTWHVSFAFCDHRELMAYNAFNFIPGREPDTSMFEDPNFYEVFRTLNFTMNVVAVKEDARFAAPVIFFEGEMEGHLAKMEGSAFLMADGNVHWSFVSGEAFNLVWSSEGISTGNVHAPWGVIGVWTTSDHDDQDPVGPFWMRRTNLQLDTDSEEEDIRR